MRYVVGRLLHLAFILFAVTFLVSEMIALMPGDPAIAVLGERATPEEIQALHKQLLLDQPVTVRYFTWAGHAISGDLGQSIRSNTPMVDLIRERAPVTLELLIGAQTLALLFALPAAIYSAYRPRRLIDNITSAVSFGLISVPSFMLALVLILVFSVHLGWFPVAGYTPLAENVWENIHSMDLPMVVLAAYPAAVYQRLLRNDMQTTLQEDFITMAEAKGLSPARILLRHALRPSMFSLITFVGITTASMIGGSVIIEQIFGLPGVGNLLIQSIQLRDVAAVQALVAVIAVAYVVINGTVDILYGVLDPRVRRVR
jgi:peptide/nickel transport system permease protein